MIRAKCLLTLSVLLIASRPALGEPGLSDLPTLQPGRTVAQNALWLENDLSLRFNSTKRVVVADIPGPATITMIHFAMPAGLKLNRDLLLRIYWDGEQQPSVDCPMVDFFCDPAGQRDEVNTALVNKRRGWNAYFPMPFRKSARVELVYDGPAAAGRGVVEPDAVLQLRHVSHARTGARRHRLLPRLLAAGDACCSANATTWPWRPRAKASSSAGTSRCGCPAASGYPVDENEKFFIDGETDGLRRVPGAGRLVRFQLGVPRNARACSRMTGYFPFLRGACAYRFFVSGRHQFREIAPRGDRLRKARGPAIRAGLRQAGQPVAIVEHGLLVPDRAARVAAGDAPGRRACPGPGTAVLAGHAQAPFDRFAQEPRREAGNALRHPGQEVIYAAPGYGVAIKAGDAWNAWNPPVYHCRSSLKDVEIEVTVPRGTEGTLRVYMIDPDNYQGGRKQTVTIAGQSFGPIDNFQEGRWIERPLGRQETAEGKVLVRATNAKKEGNAVISIIEWLEKK